MEIITMIYELGLSIHPISVMKSGKDDRSKIISVSLNESVVDRDIILDSEKILTYKVRLPSGRHKFLIKVDGGADINGLYIYSRKEKIKHFVSANFYNLLNAKNMFVEKECTKGDGDMTVLRFEFTTWEDW